MLLSINTSDVNCSVAVMNSEHKVFSDVNHKPNMHAESIFELIHAVLSSADVLLSQIKAIAVVVGPGSFFGVRVGVSLVQGFSVVRDFELLGINSLELDAFCQLRDSSFKNEPIFASVNIGGGRSLVQQFSFELNIIGTSKIIDESVSLKRTASDVCELFLYKKKYNLLFEDVVPLYALTPLYKMIKKLT